MKKAQLLQRLEQAWNDFHDSYAGLSEAQMLQPGVMGEWSVKDLLAHISWWEGEALKHLPGILEGKRPPRYSVTYGGIDAFNALMSEKTRGLTLEQALAQSQESHRQLLEYLQSVPEEQFAAETRFRRRLKLDTYGHYPLHARAIRAWREGLPKES